MDKAQDKYRAVLVEIKQRIAVIDSFIFGTTHAIYIPTTVESTCLQIRKVLELIAFSSLITNIKIYSEQYKNFSSHWNARLMIKDMERVNPNFYPHPIIQKPSKTPSITSEWLNREDDFLTKDEFILIYEKCGAILHADNPYGSKTDYVYYQTILKEWRQHIINLLDAHTIKLIDDKHLYLFQMGATDTFPSYNSFAPIE